MADFDTLWSYVFKRKESEDGQALRLLGRSLVFNDLSRAELKKIYRIIHKRVYKKDETVFKSGDPGIGMYIVWEGSIGVFVTDPETEIEQMIAHLGVGQSFGDVALFSNSQRTATIKAISATTLLGFCRPDLMNFINSNPILGNKILIRLLNLAGSRLDLTNQQLSEAKKKINEQKSLVALANRVKEETGV